MGSHRVGHHLVTEQQQSSCILYFCSIAENQRGKKKRDYFQEKHNLLVSCPRFLSTLNDTKLKALPSRSGKAVGDNHSGKERVG